MSSPAEHLSSEIALAETKRDQCKAALDEAQESYKALKARSRPSRAVSKAADEKVTAAQQEYDLSVKHLEALRDKREPQRKRGLSVESDLTNLDDPADEGTHANKRARTQDDQDGGNSEPENQSAAAGDDHEPDSQDGGNSEPEKQPAAAGDAMSIDQDAAGGNEAPGLHPNGTDDTEKEATAPPATQKKKPKKAKEGGDSNGSNDAEKEATAPPATQKKKPKKAKEGGDSNGSNDAEKEATAPPATQKKKPKKAKEGGDTKLKWEELSTDEQQRLTEEGYKAIAEFHKALQVYGWTRAVKDFNKEVLGRVKTDQAYLPEAVTASMELAEAVLNSNRSNSACLYHQRKDKSGGTFDGHAQGSTKDFRIIGVPGPRMMNLKKSDGKEPEEGLLHCGCTLESALWELIWWKTWSVTCEIDGEIITEPLMNGLPHPRIRLFIITAFQNQGIYLEDFYSRLSKVPEVRRDRLAALKKRVTKMLNVMNKLDDAAESHTENKYTLARAYMVRRDDEGDDESEKKAKKEKGKGRKKD